MTAGVPTRPVPKLAGDLDSWREPRPFEFNRVLSRSETHELSIERREVFHFHEESIGELRFDVRGIKNAIIAGELPVEMYEMTLTQEYYQHILENGGVESDRLPSINIQRAIAPGIIVLWPHGYSTLIDGNHRLVRSWQLGLRTFRYGEIKMQRNWLGRFMCRPGQEAQLFGHSRRSSEARS
jgi:hypothetical protein